MTPEQVKAANALKRALNKCGKAGLSGGVFSGHFCLWPAGSMPMHTAEFGEFVEDRGVILDTPEIYLDGGAGN